MTNFVAENLEYKIKLSSPVTKKGGGINEFILFLICWIHLTCDMQLLVVILLINCLEGGISTSKTSTPSTSGLLPRQFLLSQQLPQIDANVLNDVEIEAHYLAASVDNLTENLCNLLHSVS